jgi:hypothetical protein
VVAVSAATPPLVQQKKAPCKHRFFCFTWGVIVEPHTNALRLFAHFFRRLPKGIYLKNNILQWQSSKKIERTFKANQPKPGPEFNVLAFL